MIDSAIEQLFGFVEKKGYSLYKKAETNGGEWCGSCPFCQDGEDRFLIWPYNGNYWCRKCKKGGSIKNLLIYKMGYSLEEIQPLIQIIESYRDSHISNSGSTQPSAEWIRCLTELTYIAARALRQPENKTFLDYLRFQRYLKDETFQRFLLGLSPIKQYYKQLYIPEGILIPELHNNKALNIRVRLTENGHPVEGKDKYATVTWSKSSINKQLNRGSTYCFGLDSISQKEFLFLCEGELDCMLLWQEAGDLIDVITLGSCARNIPDQLMPLLKSYKRVFVCYDNDEGGRAGVQKVCSRLDSAKSVAIIGKDITDSYKMGQNLRKLVEYIINHCA